MPSRAKAVSDSLQIRIVFLSCAVAVATAVAIGWLNYSRTVDLTTNTAISGLAGETRLFAQKIRNTYGNLENDVFVVSRMPPIGGIIRATRNNGVDPLDQSTMEQWRARLQTIFSSMLRARNYYTQMRFIGIADGGRELVRVNQTAEGLQVVPPDQLQQKGREPYIADSIKNDIHDAVYSEVTYNRENGVVQLPPTPTLRLVYPVRDADGSLFGFIVFNVDYVKMLSSILAGLSATHDTLIIGSDGDYMEKPVGAKSGSFHFHAASDFRPLDLITQFDATPGSEAVTRGNGEIVYFVRRSIPSLHPNANVAGAYRVPESELLAPAYVTRRDSLLIGLGILVLTGVIAYLVTKRQSIYLIDMAARSRAVIESAVDGIIVIDEKGVILSDNPAAERLFQFQPGELIGKKVNVLMPEYYSREHDDYLSNYLTTGERKIIGIGREVEGLRRDGSTFPMDLSVSEIRLSGRRAFTGVVRDISERKAAEIAVRSSEERYDLVVRAMSAGFWEWDFQKKNVFWSDMMREITGYDRDQPVPSFEEYEARRHPDDSAEVDRRMQALLKHGEPFEAEYRWFRPDGAMIWLHATAICSFDESGNLLRVVGSVTDVTERKNVEKEREDLIKALAQSNRELDEFAYVASHDLKAPLRVIDNASTWLQEDLADKLDEESRENLTLLRGRVSRMEKLLDDLLEYSRVGRKTDQQWVEPVSGRQLRDDVLLLVAQKEGFQINFDEGFLDVKANRMPLQQILINLINNALKHHDRAVGTVNVSARLAGGVYEFAVSDDGPGIPERFHEQIFKMFQTLKPRDRVEGSGIGLTIVRKHLDVMGMTISVDSQGERGTVFRFTYPKPQAEQSNEEGGENGSHVKARA